MRSARIPPFARMALVAVAILACATRSRWWLMPHRFERVTLDRAGLSLELPRGWRVSEGANGEISSDDPRFDVAFGFIIFPQPGIDQVFRDELYQAVALPPVAVDGASRVQVWGGREVGGHSESIVALWRIDTACGSRTVSAAYSMDADDWTALRGIPSLTQVYELSARVVASIRELHCARQQRIESEGSAPPHARIE